VVLSKPCVMTPSEDVQEQDLQGSMGPAGRHLRNTVSRLHTRSDSVQTRSSSVQTRSDSVHTRSGSVQTNSKPALTNSGTFLPLQIDACLITYG
jgi:hypothetical protein